MPLRLQMAVGGFCKLSEVVCGTAAVVTGSGAIVLADTSTSTITLDAQTLLTGVSMVIAGVWVIMRIVYKFSGDKAARKAEIEAINDQIKVTNDRLRDLTKLVEDSMYDEDI